MSHQPRAARLEEELEMGREPFKWGKIIPAAAGFPDGAAQFGDSQLKRMVATSGRTAIESPKAICPLP